MTEYTFKMERAGRVITIKANGDSPDDARKRAASTLHVKEDDLKLVENEEK